MSYIIILTCHCTLAGCKLSLAFKNLLYQYDCKVLTLPVKAAMVFYDLDIHPAIQEESDFCHTANDSQ